jgi:hypothetical protein
MGPLHASPFGCNATLFTRPTYPRRAFSARPYFARVVRARDAAPALNMQLARRPASQRAERRVRAAVDCSIRVEHRIASRREPEKGTPEVH